MVYRVLELNLIFLAMITFNACIQDGPLPNRDGESGGEMPDEMSGEVSEEPVAGMEVTPDEAGSMREVDTEVIPEEDLVGCQPGPWPWWRDRDGDGYGDPGASVESCRAPEGYVDNNRDCDDGSVQVSPEIPEDPSDEIDNDCDGIVASTLPVSVSSSESCTPMVHEVQTDAAVKLRVFTTYRSAGRQAASVQINVRSPQPVWIAVQSYAAVTWVITEETEGTVLGVISFGLSTFGSNNPSTVNAPPGAMIIEVAEYYSVDSEYHTQGVSELIAEAERISGATFSSYAGCHQSDGFTVEDGELYEPTPEYTSCVGTSGRGPEGPGRITALPDTCADPSRGPICLTLNSGLFMVGLESITAIDALSGETCATIPTELTELDRQTGIAWLGDYLYWCDHGESGSGGALTRKHLVTGRIERAYQYCSGVSSYDGRLVLHQGIGRELTVFEDFWSAQCGSPTQTLGSMQASNFTIADNKLFAARHAGSEVEVYQLPDMTASETIVLEGYDDWIDGIATLGKDEVLILNNNREAGIWGFSTEDGSRVRQLDFFGGLGLSCSY